MKLLFFTLLPLSLWAMQITLDNTPHKPITKEQYTQALDEYLKKSYREHKLSYTNKQEIKEYSSHYSTLTVTPTPSYAKVYITNIVPKYQDRMTLPKGKYTIKVTAPHYYTQTFELDLQRDTNKKVKLNRKGIWQDSSTGLMWQVPIDSKRYNWSEAKRYCRDLHLGGYSDWRLPSRDELKSIMTKKSYSNTKSYSGKTYIKKPLFKSMDMEYQWFWSSKKYSYKSAWLVGFNLGNDSNYDMSYRGFVRCVR